MTIFKACLSYVPPVILFLFSTSLIPSSSSSQAIDDHHRALIQWLRSNGGTFNAKLEIRRSDDPTNNNNSTASSHYGIFATHVIRPKELLLEIPRSCILTAPSPLHDDYESSSSSDDLWCDTTHFLMEEIAKGNESFYAPYTAYLLSTQQQQQQQGQDESSSSSSHHQLPSLWSPAGRHLLEQLLTDHHTGRQILPPERATTKIVTEWVDDCDGSWEDNDALVAYSLLVQRGWDHVMVPIYDMMSHRKGPYLNTEDNDVHVLTRQHSEGGDVFVRASREIMAGEEIYTSRYYFCNDCENYHRAEEEYGTPEILRDYGFVEPYPQRYIFHLMEWGFDVVEVLSTEENGKEEEESRLKIEWIDSSSVTKMDKTDLMFMEERLAGLKNMNVTRDDDNEIAEREWNVIMQYRNALMTALSLAIKTYTTQGTDKCHESYSCTTTTIYNTLEYEPDDLDYNAEICDESKFFYFPGYEQKYDFIKTSYQTMNVLHNLQTKDTCFELDGIVQMCGSYRPHYHEMVVHYAARFLERVERVLWVGGGDSMLLHEILKYDSLRKVVGLELDQKVTRYSFNHFGTQPHWDKHPKVEWWYGDAAKSLLMLPRRYFGSFDLVLVDLSETVMSFQVTEELDVMEALSLLMKPDGIFVKNELYLENLSKFFGYTIQLHYYDVPVLCSQCLIMGSYKLDFLQTKLYNHNVTGGNLFIKPLNDIENKYDILHDYRTNVINTTNTKEHDSKFCSSEEETQMTTATKDEEQPRQQHQERSPGILMIIEVEEISSDITNLSQILPSALQSIGFTILSTATTSSSSPSIPIVTIIILNEGYVVARAYPKLNYCALDIHLWSQFSRHSTMAEHLLHIVLQSWTSSSYRIVAGGMFGAETWQSDIRERGPPSSSSTAATTTMTCDDDTTQSFSPDEEEMTTTTTTTTTPLSDNDALIIMEESLTLIVSKNDEDNDNITAVVLCGHPSHDTHCPTSLFLSNHKPSWHVVTLYACPTLYDDKMPTPSPPLDTMMSCESEIMSFWNTAASQQQQQRAQILILDQGAPKAMGQIIHHILKTAVNFERFVVENLLIVATPWNVVKVGDGDWRRHFLERFRTMMVYDPLFRAELVIIDDDDNTIEWGVTIKGDEYFLEHLKEMARRAGERMGKNNSLKVKNVHGGLWNYVPDFEPSQFFLPGDYDQRKPLEQWQSQRHVGHQSLFQWEWKEEKNEEVSSLLLEHMEMGLVKTFGLMEHMVISHYDMKRVTGMGEGGVIIATWDMGHVLIIWDGRHHVDANLFTSGVETPLGHEEFEAKMLMSGSELLLDFKRVLYDEQPRGYGRVVSYERDVVRGSKEGEEDDGRRKDPHWAVINEETS